MKLSKFSNKTWLFFLFIITLLLHSANYFNSDEGVVLAGAWDLMNGRELYFDFFELVTPGVFYLIYGAWKLFGVHYFVAKLLAAISLFLSALGIYKISHKITKDSSLCLISPYIFILSSTYWPIISYHIFNILFIIWALYFYIQVLSSKSKKDIIASGFLTGISILFLQHKGVVLLLVLSSFLLLLSIKEKKYLWLKLNLYYLFFALLPIILLFFKWPINLLYRNLIAFPLFNYTKVAMIPPYFPMFFLMVLFIMAWALKDKRTKIIWLLFYVQLFLLLSTMPTADHYHVSLVIFPMYALFPLVFTKISSLKTIYLRYYYCFIIFIIIFIIIFPFIKFAFSPRFYSVKNLDSIKYIKDNCQNSQYLYAGPFIPNFYFEARKLNPTPYSWLITNHHTKTQFLEAERLLAQHKPACAVLNYKMVAKYQYSKDNPVDNYIHDNYKLAWQDNNYLIYRKAN